MKIILSGGGTGGHITPILAVANELKTIDPTITVVYVGERGGKFSHILKGNHAIDEICTIYAGKFRRYYGESWIRRLFSIKTNLLNSRDFFYVIIGALQSIRLISKLKPDIVFLKGGFVGVPVGYGAHVKKIPYITHDSDAMPGLANRLVGRWAELHATALPADYYSYPIAKVSQVGVLVEANYRPVTPSAQADYKNDLNLSPDAPLLVITGGSSGAQRLNLAVRKIVNDLLSDYKSLNIVHQVGKGKAGVYADYQHDRLRVFEFMQPMWAFLGAADVVVTRASGNTVAELGIQGKACVVVPSPVLSGGHQIKNTEYLISHEAVIAVPETTTQTDSTALNEAIRSLLDDPAKREQLGRRLQSITIPDAAHKLAMLLLEKAGNQRIENAKKKETTSK